MYEPTAVSALTQLSELCLMCAVRACVCLVCAARARVGEQARKSIGADDDIHHHHMYVGCGTAYFCKKWGPQRLDYASRAASPRSHRATPMCRARPGLGCQEACSSVSPALRSK